jgi:hypothetical protein
VGAVLQATSATNKTRIVEYVMCFRILILSLILGHCR